MTTLSSYQNYEFDFTGLEVIIGALGLQLRRRERPG
jgi:hypothetical protein